ncbi:hypothetical protein O3P69_008622 [Scylla paramamosain]|uniref:Coiled-coil domain-containing protein 25 n=1 Tax=Scylla paramamosain TaxID=85552 RepID=A0AAW0SMM8_SCYPA
MNKTNPEKRNKTPGKAGCCAFIHAFLRLFRRKKRGRRAPSVGDSQAVLEKHAMEEHKSDVEEHVMEVQEVEEHLMEEQEVEEHLVEQEVQEHLMEGAELEEHLLEEPEVEEHLMKEQDTKESTLDETAKEQPLRDKSRAAQPAVEEADTSDFDFDDDVADDSGSEESSWEECPRPARQGKASQDKAKKNSKMAASPPFAATSSASELLLRPRGAVLTFSSAVVDPPATLVMGTDKHENDHLLTQATDRVVFFHVDDLPSAHVYLQLEPGQGVRDVPRALLHDAAQLCKANSAQGNKLANVAVLYTPGSNLRKTRHMKAGEVGFVSDRDVRRIVVAKRDDAVVERLTSTRRKVVSGRAEREKQQQARERQRQKTEAKLARRKQRREEQQEQAAHEDPLELEWGIELEQPSATRTTRKQRRKRREWREEDSSEEECEEEEKQLQERAQTKTTRCFPVGAAQRRLLQGCRALVERRFDVRVAPPGKGEGEGRGTVTGTPEDVADALAELKKLLYPDSQKDAARDNKGGSGKRGKDGKNDKNSKGGKNDNNNKGGKNDNNNKDGKDGRDTKAKGQNTKQKRKQ